MIGDVVDKGGMIGDVVDKVYIKGSVLKKNWANKFGRKKEPSFLF